MISKGAKVLPAAFTLFEVLVATLLVALIFTAVFPALSESGLFWNKAHQKLLLVDELWPHLLSRAQKLLKGQEAFLREGQDQTQGEISLQETELQVVSGEEGEGENEEEEKVPVWRVEFGNSTLWFFVPRETTHEARSP